MVSGASGAARSQKAQQWKGPNTIGTRELACQKRRKTGRDMQRRTRRSVSTPGGAAPDPIIGRAAADRAGARPYRAHVAKTRRNVPRRIARERVRRCTFTEGAIMERAQYNRHSRSRMAETAKDGARHATPDAPERIDTLRRCTRLDHGRAAADRAGARPYR